MSFPRDYLSGVLVKELHKDFSLYMPLTTLEDKIGRVLFGPS